MRDYLLDIDDIMNEKFMPLSLMLLESGKVDPTNASFRSLDEEFKCATRDKIKEEDGSFNNAYMAMGFHRKMINEFLCSKFVAGKILEDIKPTKILKNRLGRPKVVEEMEHDNHIRDSEKNSKNSMLYDQGSYEYKNWLAKTTTLEDIYRNYAMNPKQNKVSKTPNDDPKLRRQDYQVNEQEDDYHDEYDEGEITGYIQQPQQVGYADYGGYGPPAGGGGGYHPAPVASSGMKSLGLRDLFDIALTTLAFLSFGMFILQVLMCITMSKSNDNTSVMLPMEMTGDGVEVEAAELEVRVKRSINKYSNIKMVNDISKRTLQSIEAFIISKDDGGQCLKKYICEHNKFSRKAKDIQKYLIPVFGLGLSWLTTKVTNPNAPVTATLGNLQASLMGLGNGNCKLYNCDMNILINRRK
ncbi:unnamed protein product [Diamesa hyperborea]